jgi:hypothetical protein
LEIGVKEGVKENNGRTKDRKSKETAGINKVERRED